MELHQLRYFLAVARTRNFSRAAEQCHVAQPSLSQQIMKLEEELGERLFERTKRSVSLTPAGECLRERAERVLDELDQARDEIRGVRGLLRGRVVVGALPTVAPYLLPPLLRTFGERYPGIEVVVHEDTTAQLVRAVEAKELDLALTSLPVERHGLVAEKLFDEELLLVLPRKHALAEKPKLGLRDIEDETFILMQEGHCLAGQALQVCQLRGFAPRVSFRSAQIETVQAFVAAGFGVSIVPAMARRPERHAGVVYRPFSGTAPRRDIGLVRRRDRPLSRAAQAFAAFLRERGAGR
ncbi:MAG TPA: LysR family transcriptional regulator [Opitutaceae bacterium]